MGPYNACILRVWLCLLHAHSNQRAGISPSHGLGTGQEALWGPTVYTGLGSHSPCDPRVSSSRPAMAISHLSCVTSSQPLPGTAAPSLAGDVSGAEKAPLKPQTLAELPSAQWMFPDPYSVLGTQTGRTGPVLGISRPGPEQGLFAPGHVGQAQTPPGPEGFPGEGSHGTGASGSTPPSLPSAGR